MAPILLRLLLCLCLVANATGSAWAATTMAMPVAPAAPASAMPCHMDAGMPAAMAHAQAPPDLQQPAPHEHAPAGCKAGSCDCLQHCGSALVLPTLALPAAIGTTPLNWTLHASRGAPSPYRPVRPPIA